MMKFIVLFFVLVGSNHAWGAYSPETIIADPTTPANKATVKAASTAPVATDPALVVAISPNTPLGATSDKADGTVSPGAAPTAAILTAGQYNAVLPTFLNTQSGALQVDSNGRLFVSQGGAGGLSTAWPFKLTDGTNTMPTMDAAARKGFFQPTDGTNLMPMMDVGARAGWFKLTDGTNIAPTMDVAARAGFQKVTDGTNTAGVTLGGALKVDGSAVTQPVSSTQLPASLGQKTMANSMPVTIASDQSVVTVSGSVTAGGVAMANHARNDYTLTSVTTGAYVQLIASTAADANSVEIFDSSGQTLVLATGGAGSEVDQLYITPGGNGLVHFKIVAGTRVSIKAVSGTANVGEIDLNLYQ